MITHSPLPLLAALGVLALAAPAHAQVDTSQWTCSSCPYPKGTAASVDVGLGHVSEASAKFGDFKGLQKDGAFLVLGGSLNHRTGDYYADLTAAELGSDTGDLRARVGREGLYSLTFGYSAMPRYYADGAVSPFLGNGGGELTLPAGYGYATTGLMPASTLLPLDLSTTWRRIDLAGNWLAGRNWTVRASMRRDIRDGTKPLTASFFSTSAQLAAPVDQITDQFEVAATYSAGPLHASLAYQVSQFSNDAPALTFSNPFAQPGTSQRGQLALAPSNEFHQLVGSGGYTLSPMIRFSGDFAIGRMTQNDSYLTPTLSPGLTGTLPALPVASLDGKVDTFHGSLRATATPMPSLRLSAAYIRDVRDNVTGVRSYPLIGAELPYFGATRRNTPFSLTQDRFKLAADWRGPSSLRIAAGAEQDNKMRSYHEVVDAKETTVWLRVAAQPAEAVSLAFKAAHADRSHSTYGMATWFGSPENPLLRKYQLADRVRDSAGARVDLNIGEKLTLGFSADYADDQYDESLIGLTAARSGSAGVDLAYAFSETLKFTAFAQGERIRSRQAGSALFRAPDWYARNNDRFDVVGVGVRHAAIPDKLDVGLDLGFSRARSEVLTETALGESAFPVNKTDVDTIKLFATYKLSEAMSITGSWWYEKYDSTDWRLDGVLPATLSTLLAFGQQSPRYKVNVIRVALRYQF